MSVADHLQLLENANSSSVSDCREKVISRRSFDKPLPSCSQVSEQHSVKATATVARNGESKVPTMLRYVNTKYGTPVDQLQHLQSTGKFVSVSVDSSGCGKGPVVYCPPEANISLPTPTHCVCPSRMRHPFVSVASSDDVADGEMLEERDQLQGGGGTTLTEPANSDRTAKEEEMFHGHLTFESCFEGGNLQQATQM